MGDFVQYEKRGQIAVLTLNRPDKLNALASLEDCHDLIAALERIGDDPQISAAVLTGAGRGFSAGGDLQSMKEKNGVANREHPALTRSNYRSGVQKIPRAFRACEVPIVAAINGAAVGLGNDIGCLCDIRIASTHAKFAASFIKIGIIPGDGGAWILPRIVGFSKAAEMILTGDLITAEEALSCGLVSRVVEPDALMDEALAMAERIAANPARSLRMAKRLLLNAQDASLDTILEMSAAMQAVAHETEDHAEAVDAFLAKRPPEFSGR
ncbi:crotonase/enoyl-CoA hydratase family protein [Croceicoccus mobilis]|uniref:Enoyl-CoA hydratase n=1 Tax=Croceicoccus mobilis TaxID=1703339 RepID=A0A917DYM8_9SPHN|nr:crotonase/enoyl-CoA hydratase family protein [Croceicoccus mobilis]GGD82624.1 enoyl-CoA hydratase [Croceicoccus mobilis]